MERRVLQFGLEKETKNTVRFQEEPGEGSPAVIGTLYVQKFVLGKNPPNRLTVTIEEA